MIPIRILYRNKLQNVHLKRKYQMIIEMSKCIFSLQFIPRWYKSKPSTRSGMIPFSNEIDIKYNIFERRFDRVYLCKLRVNGIEWFTSR